MPEKITRIKDGVTVEGKTLKAFIHNGAHHFLTDIKVYKDGLIDCWGFVDINGFKGKIASGWVVTSLPEGARVSIAGGLVDFTATDINAHVREEEFVKEVADIIEGLNDRPTSSETCLAALKAYTSAPSEEAREALRIAYEAVPEHNRRYLGDMDVKDFPIRMIIYGDQEIENWSHRIVGRQQGLDPLPTIRVPKVPSPDTIDAVDS